MDIYVLVLLLTGLSTCISLTHLGLEQCSKEEQGTLDWRVKNSQVVITGTVTNIKSESASSEGRDEFDIGIASMQGPPYRAGQQTVGLVQLWSVVKGTIQHVTNYSYGVQDGQKPPMIKLYGLWNDHVCGSYVNVGETRIFFLRKLLDARSNIYARNETASLASSAPRYLGQQTFSSLIADDVIVAEPVVGKKRHKKKGRKGKKKRRHRKSRRAGRKKKSRKNGKKRSRRRRKTTESTYQSLRKLRRHKRDVLTPLILTHMQQHPLVKVRRDADEQRHVLIVASTPARITLENLNLIDGIAELE